MMEQILYQSCHPLDFQSITNIRKKITQICSQLGLSEHCQQNIALLISEYCSNLLKHAATPATLIHISLGKSKHKFWIEFQDNGSTWEELSSTLSNSELQEDLCTSGMGLGIIANLFPEHEFKKQSNTLRFHFNNLTEKPKILLIDDSPSQLYLTELMLIKDFSITIFSSAEEGLSWLENNQCELIITDLHMPTMDGMQFKQVLSKMPDKYWIPFVYISGDNNNTTMNKAASLGIDDYILKPLNIEKLKNVINRVLQRSSMIKKHFEMNIETHLPSIKPFSRKNQIEGWAIDYSHSPPPSGDFVIQHRVKTGTIFIIGDHMGHGAIAKANGSYWQGFILGLLTQSSVSIHSISTLINDAFYHQNHSHHCQLLCLLLIHINENGNVELINHGMPYPILKSGKNIEVLKKSGGLLGLSEFNEQRTYQFVMEQDQTLHVFSDGVIENIMDSCPLNDNLHQTLWKQPNPVKDDRTLISFTKR
ncbi:response regulator [Vibrio sp. Of7-15]|uniref:response regulator n=1 Tax=Vibrio sp. Of7-15 TaxID=2724879 RepID=UPI001EF16721|nr:response regulator [Vibrio sp. Of7-15]MCG7499921.1 response regulator [Vibrio sp. Of7-15]